MSSEPTQIPHDALAAPARRALATAGYTTLEQLAEVRERDIAGLRDGPEYAREAAPGPGRARAIVRRLMPIPRDAHVADSSCLASAAD